MPSSPGTKPPSFTAKAYLFNDAADFPMPDIGLAVETINFQINIHQRRTLFD
ncbi:hypothetical protein CFII64_04800 [Pseudomonas sp. CFII64]|nr:hypothetical protein CFII64_04800 [Pseudomonas sp. CFII64]